MNLVLLILAAAGAEPSVYELSAERIVHDGAHHRAYAEGEAELVTDGAALHADRITWDHDAEAATAIGHVALRLTRGELIAVVADVITVRFENDEVREVFVDDGRVYRKKGLTAEALRAIKDPEALRQAGETTLLLTSNHLTREPGGAWRLEALELVPCECNFEQPSWAIRASDASIDTAAERAQLWFPTVRVHGVPVLWLPWLSLPLSDRQTGLLVPKPGFSALNGFSLEQPVFVTLGRSADLTLTPGYFFGGNGLFGVKGPRLMSELRYAPAEGTSGRLNLGLLWDLRAPRNPVFPSAADPVTGVRGLRGEASWQHVQELGDGWHDRVDASFLSDGYYQRDLVADVLASANGYLRSAATVFHRGDDHWLGLDVVLRQDLLWGYPVLGQAPVLGGAPARGPNPLHRLPAVTWAIPERPLLGPLTFGLLADFVRLAPMQGNSGDEGSNANGGRPVAPDGEPLTVECQQQRLYWAGPLSACPFTSIPARSFDAFSNRSWDPGEREARQRLQLMPRLSAQLPLTFATLTPYAAWRQGVWLGEATGEVTQRGTPLLGARLESELYRLFGEVRHGIEPSLEVRSVPFVSGTSPAPFDEVDTAVPSTSPQLQAVAELRQRLTRGGTDLLRLDLGQGAQLNGAPRLAESYGRLSSSIGWFTESVSGRVDPVRGVLTRLSASVGLDDARGHGLYAGYENLSDEGTDRSRRPIDLLFALPPPGLSTGRAQSFTFGGRWKLGGFGLRYDALMLDRALATNTRLTLALVQHTAGLSYAPACDCFRLEVTATQRLGATGNYGFPDFGATLTVSRFGSFGVAR